MIKVLAASAASAIMIGAGVFGMPSAAAVPGQCGGGGFIGYGSFCDSDGWSDGSFWHCVGGGGPFAWGSTCNRVCDSPRGNPMPPLTDNDPNTKCPGW